MPVNVSNLLRKNEALLREAPAVAEMGVKVMAETAVQAMIEMSPYDTGRYIRGWVLAANRVPLSRSFPLPPLVPSRYYEKNKDRLRAQLERLEAKSEQAAKAAEFWGRVYFRRYESKGRNDRWSRDCLEKKKRAEKRAEKLAALVDKAETYLLNFDEYALVIYGKKKSAAQKQWLAGVDSGRPITARNLTGTRYQLYGGVGRVIRAGSRVYVQLTNLEAHASIVEKRHRVVARASARARATTGLAKISARMLSKLTASPHARGRI